METPPTLPRAVTFQLLGYYHVATAMGEGRAVGLYEHKGRAGTSYICLDQGQCTAWDHTTNAGNVRPCPPPTGGRWRWRKV